MPGHHWVKIASIFIKIEDSVGEASQKKIDCWRIIGGLGKMSNIFIYQTI